MKIENYQMSINKSFSRRVVAGLLSFAFCLLLTANIAGQTPAPDFQSVIARQASLVTEFDVNGLKVLVKRREGSQTVATQLYIRGGAENLTTSNAGVEAFMLNVASEASTSFPRDVQHEG